MYCCDPSLGTSGFWTLIRKYDSLEMYDESPKEQGCDEAPAAKMKLQNQQHLTWSEEPQRLNT